MRAVLSYLSQFHSVDPEVEREKFLYHPIHVLPYMQQFIYRLIDLVDYSRSSVRQGCRYYFDCGTLILYDNHGVILSWESGLCFLVSVVLLAESDPG